MPPSPAFVAVDGGPDMARLTTDVGRATIEERAALAPPRVLADIALLAERNLRKVSRSPGLIVFSTIQPLMQLVLFAYVFGAVATIGRGTSYEDFVVPAVLVQSLAFAAMGSGVGIAYDLQSGMIDRFRSLPIARSAFLVGRTLSDSLRLGLQSLLLVGAALVIGFSFHNGLLAAIGMVVVIVMFGMALTAFSAWVGLAIKDPETVQPAVFIPILPLVFTSSAFAPVSRLPGWMQPVAKVNPVTFAINTARGLALGDNTLFRISHTHLSTSAGYFLLSWVLIVGTFTALAVRRYRLG
jgi:ABC transporter DrrB family efflux protein